MSYLGKDRQLVLIIDIFNNNNSNTVNSNINKLKILKYNNITTDNSK